MALRKGEKRMTYEEAKQKLMPVGQEHLLQYFEELGEEEKKSLLKQIEDLDLSLLNLIEGGVKEIPKGKLEPLGAVTLEEIAAAGAYFWADPIPDPDGAAGSFGNMAVSEVRRTQTRRQRQKG